MGSTAPPSSPPSQRKRSSSALKVLAAALAALLVAGALIGFSYTQINASLKSVEFAGVTFREPSVATLASLLTGNVMAAAISLLDELVLVVTAEVGNGGFLPVIIPPAEFDLAINRIPVGSGRSGSSYTVGPRELVDIPIRLHIRAAGLRPLLASIASTSGELDVTLKGKVKASLLAIPLDIPFESTKHVSLREIVEKKVQAWRSRISGGDGVIPTDFAITATKWLVGGEEVASASADSGVTAVMTIRAQRRFAYMVTLEVRQDRRLLPDVPLVAQSYSLVMQLGETKELSLSFTAGGGLTVRGYFMSLRWPGNQWQMPAEYPPRLLVR